MKNFARSSTQTVKSLLVATAIACTLDASAARIYGNPQAEQQFNDVELTAYSARCEHDPYGGRNDSPSKLKPRSHTLDGNRDSDGVVLVAVPQVGGTKSLVGCFLEFDVSRAKMSKAMKAMFSKKKFFAGDHYHSRSNNMKKADISYSCRPDINNLSFKNVTIRRGQCVSNFRRGSLTAVAAALKNPSPTQVASRSAPAPSTASRGRTTLSAASASRSIVIDQGAVR